MRFSVAYYLLLLYCTMMVRCAIPAMCDELSHLFNEEKHIATIHAVYGSHHLQKEEAAVSQNNSSKHTSNFQQDEPNPVHTHTQNYSCLSTSINIRITRYLISQSLLPDITLAGITQPPEIL